MTRVTARVHLRAMSEVIARLRHALSTYLGLGTGLATIAVAVEEIVFWSQHGLPGVSQTGFFFNVGLIAVLGALQALLAMRPGDNRRGAAMTAIALDLVLVGSISGGAGSTRAIWLVYAGLIGLIAAASAILDAPHPWISALAGVVAAVPLVLALNIASYLVGSAFP